MAEKKKGWFSKLFGGKKERGDISQNTEQEQSSIEDSLESLEDHSKIEKTPNSLESRFDDSDTVDLEDAAKESSISSEVMNKFESGTQEVVTHVVDDIKEVFEDQFTQHNRGLSDGNANAENDNLDTASHSTDIQAENPIVLDITEDDIDEVAESGPVLEHKNDKQEQILDSALPFDGSEVDSELDKEPTKKRGFFARLSSKLSKTRSSLTEGLADLFLGKKEINEEILEELETRLLMADVGIKVTDQMLTSIRDSVSRKSLSNVDELFAALKIQMKDILLPVEAPLVIDNQDHKPYVILMIGVNGVGKTTTIGKLAKKFQGEGKSVMLAAGDTFRAAAVEQLEIWGKRNNISVISQKEGADPASVIFDAMESAKARKIDVLIADTAGRLHTDSGLMQELGKINRVMKRHDESAPHEVMLVVDASTGQNALNQARQFNETVPISGITFTKLDGTAKGGIIFAIAEELKIPIRFIGVGESIDDLRPFNATEFVDALMSQEEIR